MTIVKPTVIRVPKVTILKAVVVAVVKVVRSIKKIVFKIIEFLLVLVRIHTLENSPRAPNILSIIKLFNFKTPRLFCRLRGFL